MVNNAKADEHGFLIHSIASEFQTGTTLVRVLLPDSLQEGKLYRVIYVLPVEAGTENRYGDGLLEIKRHNLHNKHQVVFAAPTFAQLPWYADHPTNASIRQESHFLRVVLPLVERTYPVMPRAEGRFLLGFSKSGWGAWSMLLRHADVFQRAAAWDAPLTMTRIGKYGNAPIFGTQENFEAYCVASLLRQHAKQLGSETRFVLTGIGNFRQQHEDIHALLNELHIPHAYRSTPLRKHTWGSGWVPEAVELLLHVPNAEANEAEVTD